jgi:hypothetical protein
LHTFCTAYGKNTGRMRFAKFLRVNRKRKNYIVNTFGHAFGHTSGMIDAEIAERNNCGDVNQVKPRRGGGVREATYENRRQ